MTRQHDAGKFCGYLGRARESSTPLDGWPLHEWWLQACEEVEASAPATVEAGTIKLNWMSYRHSRDTTGTEHGGTWHELVQWLTSATEAERNNKLEMVVWQPTVTSPGRKDHDVHTMTCLVLDSDTGVDHHRMHDVLCRAGIAHFGHASPSSTDGTPKWRLVLPLATPVAGDELVKWTGYYTAARLILGAAGKVWFDSSCGNRARIWYAGRLPQTSAREVWGTHLVDAQTSPFRTWRALDLRALVTRFDLLTTIAAAPLQTWKPQASVVEAASMSDVDRCRAYISRIPPGADGGTRGPARYKAAAAAVCDFGLSDGDAFMVLSEWNSLCSPPASPEKVRDAINNARKYGKHAPGQALTAAPPPRFAEYALRNTKAGAAFRGAGNKSATSADHDQTTAEYAIRAGCDDEEAVNAVLARPDGHAAQQGTEYAQEVVARARQKMAPKPVIEAEPEEEFSTGIDRMEVQMSAPPIYTLFLGEAAVRVTAAELLNRQRLTVAIMEAVHRVPNLPPARKGEYEAWVNHMLHHATKVEVGEDASVDYGEREELEHMISSLPQSEDVDRLASGCLYVQADSPEVEMSLRSFMGRVRQMFPAMSRPTVVRHLRALGWSDSKRMVQGKEMRIWRGKL